MIGPNKATVKKNRNMEKFFCQCRRLDNSGQQKSLEKVSFSSEMNTNGELSVIVKGLRVDNWLFCWHRSIFTVKTLEPLVCSCIRPIMVSSHESSTNSDDSNGRIDHFFE